MNTGRGSFYLCLYSFSLLRCFKCLQFTVLKTNCLKSYRMMPFYTPRDIPLGMSEVYVLASKRAPLTLQKDTSGSQGNVMPCHLLAHRFLQRYVWGIDTFHPCKARMQKSISVANSACHQSHGSILRMFQNAHRQLAHKRLTVGRALARNDKVGSFCQFTEMYGVEQYLYA